MLIIYLSIIYLDRIYRIFRIFLSFLPVPLQAGGLVGHKIISFYLFSSRYAFSFTSFSPRFTEMLTASESLASGNDGLYLSLHQKSFILLVRPCRIYGKIYHLYPSGCRNYGKILRETVFGPLHLGLRNGWTHLDGWQSAKQR